FGSGMDKSLDQIIKHVDEAGPLQINMAGHSRGAVLCHMVARKLYEIGKRVPITIAALDPVHMSNAHGDVGKLPPTVEKYQAIVMENENKPFLFDIFGAVFQFQFVDTDGEDTGRVYYINMPGKHGSGTQLTSPIGRVCYELIANFMRKRGAQFTS